MCDAFTSTLACPSGGIGRRKGLKIPRNLVLCRFKSGLGHLFNNYSLHKSHQGNIDNKCPQCNPVPDKGLKILCNKGMVNLMSDPDIRIRKAGVADITLLSRLIRDSHRDVAERFGLTSANCPKHPSNCTDEWIEKDLARSVAYFIMEFNSIPVGCAAIEQASPDACYLERLSVLPDQRKTGLGKALVNYVLLKARKLGAIELNIGIIARHTELKEWYRRIGFVEGETKVFEHLPFSVTFMKYPL